MATFLVDYENVHTNYGLKGVEYLTEKDVLCMFYSQCCNKIRTDIMTDIKNSGCKVHSYKLLKTGKNALDFYIASECGIVSNQGEKHIVIVSRDKGFQAVVDFFRVRKDELKTEVVTASNIENGIIALHGPEDKERREEIKKKVKMLDLENECIKYKEQIEYQTKIIQAFQGTKYEFMLDKILKVLGSNRTVSKKDLYTGSLHYFGRNNGTEIYHLLKEVV